MMNQNNNIIIGLFKSKMIFSVGIKINIMQWASTVYSTCMYSCIAGWVNFGCIPAICSPYLHNKLQYGTHNAEVTGSRKLKIRMFFIAVFWSGWNRVGGLQLHPRHLKTRTEKQQLQHSQNSQSSISQVINGQDKARYAMVYVEINFSL